MSSRLVRDWAFDPGLYALILILPWFALDWEIWTLDGASLFLPLDAEIFERVFEGLGGYRIVLPVWSLEPYLLFLCVLSPLILLLWFLLLRSFIPGKSKWRNLAALVVASVFFYLGRPGQIDPLLFKLFFFSLVLLPLVRRKPDPLLIWSVATVTLTISLITGKFMVALFFIVIMSLFSQSLHFVFIDRMKLSVPTRKKIRNIGAYVLGILLISLFVLLSLKLRPWNFTVYQPWDYWWLFFVPCTLCVALTWIKPWESQLWLRLSSLSIGVLITDQMAIPVMLLSFWLCAQLYLCLLQKLKQRRIDAKKSPSFVGDRLAPYLGLLAVTVTVTLNILFVQMNPSQRTLKPVWVRALKEMQLYPKDGFSVIGDSMGLLAQFHQGRIIENAPIELLQSEEDVVNWMAAFQLDHLIIDQEFIRRIWKQVISSGRDPQLINTSVMSRLVLYSGKQVQTKTLELEPLDQLIRRDIPLKGLIWVDRLSHE